MAAGWRPAGAGPQRHQPTGWPGPLVTRRYPRL